LGSNVLKMGPSQSNGKARVSKQRRKRIYGAFRNTNRSSEGDKQKLVHRRRKSRKKKVVAAEGERHIPWGLNEKILCI